MPLDDDDNPALPGPQPTNKTTTTNTTTTTTTPGPSTAAAAVPDDLTAEDLIEDEGAAAQDFRLFRKTPGVSAQTIRKGEKDFESHGTRAQADALEQSRAAMGEVLAYTRVHAGPQRNLARGWVFQGWWAGFGEGEEEVGAGDGGGAGAGRERKPYGFVRERVVVLEGGSVASMNLGRAVTGQAKDRPARGKDWLLPEEALYLVERGSLDLWWPLKGLEEIFPPETAAATATAGKEGGEGAKEEDGAAEADEYELGFPLSLQAAYALLIGNDGERGKVSLQKFQVYSNLKRCGYNVLRAPPAPKQPPATPSTPITTTLWQWFANLLTSNPHHQPYGPLVQPGLHRSYASIYRQMALLPLHQPSATPSSPPPKDPFAIHYHVWKAAQKWTKLRHPPPDFQLAVVDAQESAVPTLEEATALLDATPLAPGRAEWAGHPGRMYARLKHGHRHVLVAVSFAEVYEYSWLRSKDTVKLVGAANLQLQLLGSSCVTLDTLHHTDAVDGMFQMAQAESIWDVEKTGVCSHNARRNTTIGKASGQSEVDNVGEGEPILRSPHN
ncbi:hypothetical protein BT67DRAFT_457007 [Trichocladium antarcticum]|uniref:tRNA-splicing endonuclease subunit Sen54 N-terminal domain-containing protein n=1 Tax=Trichocladium antarcticum TaxID=1450529 RepID=A0AAN6UH67_9PEZI|nr:hypothetical protein BT67DRAFT_457007 [Trichocladium antarcticum]